MKKLHTLIFKSFTGPFFMSSAVVWFILLLQFIAKYKDDVFGKGLDTMVMLKFCYYAGATLIPISLPLGILLSSLMTVGKMGEYFELAAIKSSGISLFRVVKPMTWFTMIVVAGSLYFSCFVMPRANLKLFSLIYELSKVKPTFMIESGHFYKGIDGYVFHAAEVDNDRNMLYKLQIYDHTDKNRKGNLKIYLADSAIMQRVGDRYLFMKLFHGVGHEELAPDPKKPKAVPYSRYYYDTLNYHFQMAGFNMEEGQDASFLAPHQGMKNVFELRKDLDSMSTKDDLLNEKLGQNIRPILHVDSVFQSGESDPVPDSISALKKDKLHEYFPENKQVDVCKKAAVEARNAKNYIGFTREKKKEEEKRLRKFLMEYYTRFMLPLSCLVFLSIGAPLGAIVRKGGIGLPTLFSILFFVIFYATMSMGRKFSRDGFMPPIVGSFLPVFLLLPIGLFLTWQASKDSAIMDLGLWGDTITGFFTKKKVPAKKIPDSHDDHPGFT